MIINQSSDDSLKNSLCIYETVSGKQRIVKKAKALNTETMMYTDKNDADQICASFMFWAQTQADMGAIQSNLDSSLHQYVSLRPDFPIKSLVWAAEDSDAYIHCIGQAHSFLFECTACQAAFCALVDTGDDIWTIEKDNPTDKFLTATKTTTLTCPSCDATMDAIFLR